jgi:acylphosphatase
MHLHAVVRGRVQGVGFRWFVRAAARRLGLSGWVRNLGDGAVEVAADGAAESIEAFRRALREGPAGATVIALDDLPPHDGELAHPFVIHR